MKKLLFPFVLLLFAFQCDTPEPEPMTPTPLGNCQLTSSSLANPHFTFALPSTYTYSNDQLTTILTSVDSILILKKFTYDTKGRIIEMSNGSHAYVSEYNDKNQLVKQTQTRLNFSAPVRSDEIFITFHSYNAAGQLQESTQHRSDEPSSVLSRLKYTYTNGANTHIEKTTYGYDGSVPNSPPFFIEDITIQYDGKPTPLAPEVMRQLHHPLFEKPLVDFAAGNVTSYRIVKRSNSQVMPESYTAVYTYQEKGYPTTKTITTGTQPSKETFTYTCD